DLAGRRPAEAEHALGARIIAIDGAIDFARDDPIAPGARLVVYGMLDTLLDSAARQLLHQRATGWLFGLVRRRWRPGNIRWSRIDPIFGRLTVVAALLIALGVWYFHDAFASKSVDWLGALFFVLTTMTTNGYTGELIPDLKHPIDLVGAMLLMLSATVLSRSLILFPPSRLT